MTDMSFNQHTARHHGHPLAQLADALATRIAARKERKSLRKLLDLDAHMLRDIGLTESDVAETLNQPLSIDAATELHRISLTNRRLGM